ncbi:hypothetical protein HPC72_09840 [Actinomyces marmotae]|uniref:Uncharacterized protein n=2 Tax=Actinomyces marmotae TaxID=2737173 RepID=A0A6M8B717_9ACTO|nr:hypothetical protein HPC72_09840 [Actinomyces marmotae]
MQKALSPMSSSSRRRHLPVLVGLMAASSLIAPVAMAAGEATPPPAASPKIPTISATTATCHAPKNLVTVSDFDPEAAANYRIVVAFKDLGAAAAVDENTTKEIFTTGNGAFDIYAFLKERNFAGSSFDTKKATFKLYYFDSDNKYAGQYADKNTIIPGQTRDKMVPLGNPLDVTYEDPDKVCEKTMPATPKVEAALVNNRNDVTISGATTNPQKNYRFVAELPDNSKVALPDVYSEHIVNGETTINVELVFGENGKLDEELYGKPIKVQAYYFDAEKRYAPTTYVDSASVIEGETKERFIKLGEPQVVTLTKPNESAKPDAPAPETPKPEAPAPETPKPDTPAPEAPKPEAPKTGWVKNGTSWNYIQSSGAKAFGWLNDGGTWYYLDSTGTMRTGWIALDGTWYYLNPTTGAMHTGWIALDGTWYYLDASGAMATGWIALDGRWYYLNPTTGAMHTGWLNDAGTWYYLMPDGSMATGWVYDAGTWYFMNASGAWIA